MKRKNLLVLLFIYIVFCPWSTQSQNDPALEWNLLYPKIRDQLISRKEAQEKLRALEALLKSSGTANAQQKQPLCFPLKGYGPSSIGGKEGNGYQIFGYDFFDGDQHKGHPGHDIFVRDRNQDCIDDRTGKPVEVVAAAPGIIVSINANWNPSSTIRGGNYIWIFEPARSRYYYYAHLGKVLIKLGQMVSDGETLGLVGRTGLNAYPKRSPTHLHFTVHESKGGHPRPIDPFKELMQAH
ncbi:MAG TPA: M23 family metallopeptidase [Thermodesulfobacteriota bacterium]|nr:M23 family metallopeptidase [Thermodesulfobacteriota bacterium]